jgi:hypothetical protein
VSETTLSDYAPIPPSLDFPGAAALPTAIETATRALDQLGVGSARLLLINGASEASGKPRVPSLVGWRLALSSTSARVPASPGGDAPSPAAA